MEGSRPLEGLRSITTAKAEACVGALQRILVRKELPKCSAFDLLVWAIYIIRCKKEDIGTQTNNADGYI